MNCQQWQKDRVMCKGKETRELWMHEEERNKDTAKKYSTLG